MDFVEPNKETQAGFHLEQQAGVAGLLDLLIALTLAHGGVVDIQFHSIYLRFVVLGPGVYP